MLPNEVPEINTSSKIKVDTQFCTLTFCHVYVIRAIVKWLKAIWQGINSNTDETMPEKIFGNDLEKATNQPV